MKKFLFAFFCLLLAASPAVLAKNTQISLVDLNEKIKQAKPGDTLFISSGVYKDINLELKEPAQKTNL